MNLSNLCLNVIFRKAAVCRQCIEGRQSLEILFDFLENGICLMVESFHNWRFTRNEFLEN